MNKTRQHPAVVLLAAAIALLMVLAPVHQMIAQIVQTPLPGTAVAKYVDPLPTFVGARVDGTVPLTITMRERQQKILTDAFYTPLPAPYNSGAYVWAYEINNGTSTFGPLYPSFTIEAQRGTPTNVTYVNELRQADGSPAVLQQYLKIDQSIHWAAPLGHPADHMLPYAGPVPAVVHLHGGEVASEYDGGPDSWFTPGNVYTGPAWSQGVSNFYSYVNSQEATTLWYHDHTLGATRINVYAGMAGFYFLRDARDNGLASNPIGLPYGAQEIEIAIQDRMFDTNGQLYWPSVGINPMVHPFWLPEFFGDVIVVNGKAWPYLNVEPRRYRFRMLDGCNARFLNMKVMNLVTMLPGPPIWQIGTDGGLLDAAVAIVNPNRLLMGPGERADVIIDFTNFAGQTLTLVNDAKAPFPAGAPANPNTVGQILQFRVGTTITPPADNATPINLLPLRATPLEKLANFATGAPAVAVQQTRKLTLNEVMGMAGPLEVLVNNTKWDGTMSPNAGGVTEVPKEGETEVWQIINLTADAHPIHLHLVQFQLLSRQTFQTGKYLKAYNGLFPGGVSPVDGLTYAPGVFIPGYGPPKPYNFYTGWLGGNPDFTPYVQGPLRPANANERGWKDTFVMYPGEVTTVIVRFAPTDKAATLPPTDPQLQFAFNPASGPGFVWHCHIVDHEDNEMMRPYTVLPHPSRGLGALAGTTPAEDVPSGYGLAQNSPNPFNPSTEIGFQLPENSRVTLKLYNSLGQEVKTLIDADAPAGNHTVKLDAKNLASGMYFYRIQAGNFTATKKMLLMK